jgi:hypothetical protein
MRMPSGAPKLSEKEIQILQTWIEFGELSDSPISMSLLDAIGDEGNLEITGEPKQFGYVRAPYPIFAVHESSNRLYLAGIHEVLVFDLTGQRLLSRWTGFDRQISAICVDSSGTYVAVISGRSGRIGTLHVVETRSPEFARRLAIWNDIPIAMAFSPSEPKLLVGGMDGSITLFDAESRTRLFESAAHADQVLSVAWDSKGTRWISGSRDRTARSYDAKTHELIASYSGHERAVGAVGWLTSAAITVDETGNLRVWSPSESDKLLLKRSGLQQRLQQVASFQNSLIWLNGDRWELTEFLTREVVEKVEPAEPSDAAKNTAVKKKKVYELGPIVSQKIPARNCSHWHYMPSQKSFLMTTRDGWFYQSATDHLADDSELHAAALWYPYPSHDSNSAQNE